MTFVSTEETAKKAEEPSESKKVHKTSPSRRFFSQVKSFQIDFSNFHITGDEQKVKNFSLGLQSIENTLLHGILQIHSDIY